jgi:hypothetical protein
MGQKRNTYRVLVGNREGRNRFEGLSIFERIAFKWLVRA